MSADTLRRLVELARVKQRLSEKQPSSHKYDDDSISSFIPRKQQQQRRHRDRTFSLDGKSEIFGAMSKIQTLTIDPPPRAQSFRHVRSFSQPRVNVTFVVDTVDAVLFKQSSPSTRSDYEDAFDEYLLSPSLDKSLSIHPLNLSNISPTPSMRSNCSPRVFETGFTPRNTSAEKPTNSGSNVLCMPLLPPRLSVCSTVSESNSMLSRPDRFARSVRMGADDTMEGSDVYMFEEPFGQGASAQVHKGMHVPTCSIIACKRTSSLNRLTIRQLLQECRAQLDRLPDIPQVLKLRGWYRDEMTNDFVIAMEYMDLGSVFDCAFVDNENRRNGQRRKSTVISNGNKIEVGGAADEDREVWSSCMRAGSGHRQIFIGELNWDEIRHIAKEVLIALDAFHDRQKPLIHRDIKPQNILLSSNGDVKVADFGLLYEMEGRNEPNRPSYYYCSDAKGTRKYFSPERIESEFDTGADIWAFGISMIEIAQQRLISANVLNDFKIGQDDFDATTLIADHIKREDIPEGFEDFIALCLRRNPRERATAYELLDHPFILACTGDDIDKFVDTERDSASLEKYLEWMEDWVLTDEEMNAGMFLDGNDEDLMECIRSLSNASGFDVKSIDARISEEYRNAIEIV